VADTDAGILVAGEMRGRARMGRDAMTVRGTMVAACAQGRPLVAAVPGGTCIAWIMVLLARSIPVTEDTVNGPGKVLAHTAEM
jgi:hypothetical protein